jgi:hypothetical protein
MLQCVAEGLSPMLIAGFNFAPITDFTSIMLNIEGADVF